MSAGAPVGRDDLLAEAWQLLRARSSVVVAGPAGAGKSTVLEALAARAQASGERVLRCGLTETEAGLPFLALIDLLSGLDGDPAWEQLPAPWRAALSAVHDGTAAGSDQAQQLAIRLAIVHLWRALAARRPVLLVIDDLQWMDPASAEVLGFAARRVEGIPVRVLAARRLPVGAGPQPRPAVCPPPVRELPLPPLPARALGELLYQHLGMALGAGQLNRVRAASEGNPLFALEIARALARLPRLPGPAEPLPVPDRLRAVMRDRLTGLSPAVRQTLLVAAAAARPTLMLLQRAGRRRASAELAAAAALGIVEVERGGIIRFTHPLLAATLSADAPVAARQRLHAQLAQAVADPIERARHRACAATGPDESIANALSRAARAARRRGAPGVAAELSLAAADRSPALARATTRRLHAAADALAAGHCEQARQAAESVLATATARRQRVRAWLVILDATGQALPHADPLIAQALADAGAQPGLQAQIRLRVVAKALVEGRLTRALVEASRCCELATAAGDQPTLLRALCMRATAELAVGHPELAGTLRRAQALPAGAADPPLYQGPRHLLARTLLNQDRFEAARVELAPLIARAEQAGQVEDLAGLLLNLAELEVRAGRCQLGRSAAQRGLGLVEDADLSAGPCLSVAALAEAAGGDLAQARALAERGVRCSEADGDQFFLPRNLHALGYAALVAGDAPAAAGALRRVAEIEARMGQLDPALFRWHADLVEALVANRELAEAAEALAAARLLAGRLGRSTVLAALSRAEAWLLLARRQPGQAVPQLEMAAAALSGLPLEHGRTLYAAGVAQRRRRRRSAARDAFRAALAVFERAGAVPWAARARAELTHTEPVAGAGLTSIEHQIARLVTTGATNQQVATALSVSVKTVEAYLTRIYRKLRVRSRAELAGSFAAAAAPGAAALAAEAPAAVPDI